MKEQIEVYPLTIIADRYDGAYSDAKFLAFNLFQIPNKVGSGDEDEAEFWREGGEHEKYKIGRGEDPNAALLDLISKIEQ